LVAFHGNAVTPNLPLFLKIPSQRPPSSLVWPEGSARRRGENSILSLDQRTVDGRRTSLPRLVDHWMRSVQLGIKATVLLWLTTLASIPVYANDSIVSDVQPSLWLDASNSDHISFDNLTRVTSWQDKSGNSNNAVAVSTDKDTYPLYIAHATAGGSSALLFDSGCLELSKEISSKTLTIFCVVGPKWETVLNAILGGSDAGGGIEFCIGKGGHGNVLVLNRQNEESLLAGVKKLPTDKLSVVCLVVDGQQGPDARITFRLDSSEDRTADRRPNFEHGFHWVGYAQGTDNYFRGYIAEIIVFTRALGLGDLQRIEHYLTDKYNDPTYAKPVPFQRLTAETLFADLRSFMKWDSFPKDYKALLDACLVNIEVAGVAYFLFVLSLYGIAPSRFAAWHEWIANGKIPFSDKVVKVLAPLFLSTPYCLNAVVRRYRERALDLFESVDEVKLRPEWIPAPMTIGDESISEYKRPADLPPRERYVTGLFELKSALGPRGRLLISIEGPGGVGKSSLAFQIARWACHSRLQYRLAPYPMLPVLVGAVDGKKELANSVDEAAASKLELIMETPSLSGALLQALLRQKRVLVVVDGASEMKEAVISTAIRPDQGAKDSRALVVTSRVPTRLPDSVVIKPQSLTLKFLDRVLDPLIEVTVGSGRFEGDQRETLRDRLKDLMKESGDGSHERQLPMIFLRLMIQRADQLLNEGKKLNELPRTLADLVNSYTEQLLANATDDLVALVKQAREAAKVCMGVELTPVARSQAKYIQAGLPPEALETFVTSGLMAKFGEASDPFYKFALDPVAEQLSVNRLVFALRDGTADKSEIDDLGSKWESLTPEFVSLFMRTAAPFRADIDKPGNPLAARLFAS
jgi:hypothetical protein